jgi:flagellar protein FlaG
MGMEIPGLVQKGIHPEYEQKKEKINLPHQATRKARQKVNNRNAQKTRANIEKALKNIEQVISHFNRRFKIRLDTNINRIIIKVIDKDTDKVIKVIPPEEIQHLIAKINEMMGLLVDKTI